MSARVRASFLHLCISIFVVTTTLILVSFIWYPHPYFSAMGVGKILLILALVDVFIGPFITLIIYNPAKKSLKFDLAIVALLQVSALAYGVSTVFNGRPVYVVFNVNMFTLVSANDIPKSEFEHPTSYNKLPLLGPQIIGAKLPSDKKERDRLFFSALNAGADLAQIPRYYVTYASLGSEVKTRIQSVEDLLKNQKKENVESARRKIDRVIADNKLTLSQVGFIPMRGKATDLTVLVRRSDAGVIDVVDISPW